MDQVSNGGESFRTAVLHAIAEYDSEFPNTNDYRNWLENKTFHYQLVHDERLYPPKRIAEIATRKGIHGLTAVAKLREAGFTVDLKPDITLEK
jgi:hypothetical protein